MAYAENDGIKIYYDVVGNGPPFVLVHALFGSHAGPKDLGYVDLLKDCFQLILVDVRGHGQSDKPHDSALYSANHLAKDIVAVLDDLNIKTTHFFGYSMGGYIGFCCAKHARSRFDSFVLGGCQPFKDPPEISASAFWLPLLEKGGMENAVAVLESAYQIPSEYKQRLLSNDSDAIIAYLKAEGEYFDDILSEVSNPFLLFCGDQDGCFTLAKSAAEILPNAKFVSLEGDHYTVHSNTRLLLKLVKEFLSN